jgi:hypothetical protein
METQSDFDGVFRDMCVVAASRDMTVAQGASDGRYRPSNRPTKFLDVLESPAGLCGGTQDLAHSK